MTTEYFDHHGEEHSIEKFPSVSSIFLDMPGYPEAPSKKTVFFQPPSCARMMFRKVKKKFPKIVITYDREEIRKKIERLTFAQARRLMKEIYEPAIEELLEEASPCWARHFANFFEKEKELRQEDVIKDTLNENRELLGIMLDKVKLSDKAMAEPTTKKIGYQHLYELMLILEPYQESFDWLIKDMYSIIANMCLEAESLETGAYEIISRIYLKYADYLDSGTKDIEGTEFWIEKAFKLARGELWPIGFGDCDLTIHEYVAPAYSDIMLRHAGNIMSDDLEAALKLTHEAILVLCEVGIDKFIRGFCRAHLVGAALLAENHYFDEALEFLYRIEEKIHENDLELEKMLSDYYYWQGVCFMNLQHNLKALEVLQKALKAARKFTQRQEEATILLVIAQLINSTYNDRCTAIHIFEQSADIFKELGDIENEKRTKYLFATLKSELIFPFFMDLVKGVDEKVCAVYYLRQWKDLCIPFWTDIPKDFLTPVDPLHCLLEEDA